VDSGQGYFWKKKKHVPCTAGLIGLVCGGFGFDMRHRQLCSAASFSKIKLLITMR
jgi:hypothetical protein